MLVPTVSGDTLPCVQLVMPQHTRAEDAMLISIATGSMYNEMSIAPLEKLKPAAPPGTIQVSVRPRGASKASRTDVYTPSVQQTRAPDPTDFLRHRQVPVETITAALQNLHVKVARISPTTKELREIVRVAPNQQLVLVSGVNRALGAQKRVIQVSSLTAQFSEPYVSNDRLLVTLESKVGSPRVALLG